MKHFALTLLVALTWSVNAQITYPYNPDGNGDQYIAVYDLQDFLSAYGQEWIPGEIVVDSIPLSAYLDAMEALILANAIPAGTNPGQFLRWSGDAWELVMPKVGWPLYQFSTCEEPFKEATLTDFECLTITLFPNPLTEHYTLDVPVTTCLEKDAAFNLTGQGVHVESFSENRESKTVGASVRPMAPTS